MKVLKAIGLLVAFVCIGVAGWRLSKIYGNDDRRPTPGGATNSPVPRQPAAAQKLPPLVKPAKFVLQDIPKFPVVEMTDADWRAAYPDVVSNLDGTTEVVPIAIPWRFGAVEASHNSDAPLAQTMAFLVGSDLAWVPSVMDMPPAFAVFRKSGDKQDEIVAAYDAKSIAARVKDWGGTHAIGGVLVRGKDGFVATLQIFDPEGKTVQEVAFEQPRPFFELLGDVSVAAMKYFKASPNEALVKHLHRERCKQTDSLVAFGRTAFVPVDATSDFGTYASILREDPGFAEVRYWRAVWQRHISADGGDFTVELRRSLTDAPHVGALADLASSLAPNEFVNRDTTGWLEAVEALAGADHPDVRTMRLIQARGERPWRYLTLAQMRPYVQCAQRYPHHLRLVDALASSMSANASAADPELAASLALTRLFDKRRPAPDPSEQWRRIGDAATALGRYGHVFAVVDRMKQQPDAVLRERSRHLLTAYALMQNGEFERAAEAYAHLIKQPLADSFKTSSSSHAAFCAAIVGRTDLLDAMLLDPAAADGTTGQFLATVSAYQRGEPIVGSGSVMSRLSDNAELLLAEAELAQGGDFTDTSRAGVWRSWTQRNEPELHDRLRWILLERYFRAQKNLPHVAGFYEAGEWERPDDPAVKAAVQAWREAGGDRTLPSPDEVVKMLQQQSPPMHQQSPTWLAVARIRRSIEEGQIDDARRVIDAMAMRTGVNSSATRLAWLMRKVENAAAKTESTR